MRRRDFIKMAGCLGAIWSLAARAQEPGRIYRLGQMSLSPRNAPQNVALREALKSESFVEEKNLVLEAHGFGLSVDELAERAATMVKARIDVFVCGGESAIRAAQQATKTIPIAGVADDMLKSGFVASLAKPEGNTTGVSILATELDSKRQEILLDALPGVRRMATLADANTTLQQQLQTLHDTAQARGVELSIYRTKEPEEIAAAIDAAKNSGAQALNVLASAMLYNNRQLILPRVAALGLPTMYQWPAVGEEGGFIGYGPRLERIYGSILSRQVVNLLRGAKPADIPVEQPTKFELVVNLRTAKAIGLDIPDAFLRRADEVIE
jgi:ABC-type uncharacterized transport system substrate-binding protein